MTSGATHEKLGLRDLLAEVNLRDFFVMVLDELGLIGNSVRLALESRTLLLPLALLVALLRLALLVVVIVLLGTAILAVMLLRGVTRLRPGSHRLRAG